MSNHIPDASRKAIFAIVVLALIGIGGVLLATSVGIGVSPDSIVYFDSARHLANGEGYVTRVDCGIKAPVVKWPPLFPLILSVLEITGMDPVEGSRWLIALLFGANIVLVGVILYKFTQRAFYIPVLGSFLTLTSTVMLNIHSMAWTEPLFIFLGSLGLFMLTLYFHNERGFYLIAASTAIALACLDRYLGSTLVIAGLIGILCLSRQGYYRRFTDSVIFAGITLFPMALLLIRNYYLTGHVFGERVGQPVSLERMDSILISISSWLFPGSEIFKIFPAQDLVMKAFLIMFLLILVILSIRLFSEKTRPDHNNRTRGHFTDTPVLFLIFLSVYLAILVAVVSFLDGTVELDNRILSPVYVACLMPVLYLLHRFFRSGIKRGLRASIIIMATAFAAVYLAAATAWTTYSHFNGRQFTNKDWQGLEIEKELEIISRNALIFSNHHKFIYFETRRPACPIESIGETLYGPPELKNGADNPVVVYFESSPDIHLKMYCSRIP